MHAVYVHVCIMATCGKKELPETLNNLMMDDEKGSRKFGDQLKIS